MRAARGVEAASSGRGEVSGGRLRRRLFYCDSLSLDQLSCSRAIKGALMKIVHLVVGRYLFADHKDQTVCVLDPDALTRSGR